MPRHSRTISLSVFVFAEGSAAERADGRNMAKYAKLVPSGDFSFMPVAIEILSAWGPSALALCSILMVS